MHENRQLVSLHNIIEGKLWAIQMNKTHNKILEMEGL